MGVITHGKFARDCDVRGCLREDFEQWAKGGCRARCPVSEAGVLARLVYGGSGPPLSVALMPAKNSDAAVILWVRVSSLAAFSGMVFSA